LATDGNQRDSDRRKVIVWTTGEHPVGWRLPPAIPYAGRWIPGGVRTLHELAVAIAVTGRTVELRGLVLSSALEELSTAAGAGPALPTESRRPDIGDVVIVPEAIFDPLELARLVLSGARVVLVVLAPTGLIGWPLVGGHVPASPLEVDPQSLARPEHFSAMAALGIGCWTHMLRIQELAAEAGVGFHFIGNGDPLPPPAPAQKNVDVVWLKANRWAPLAEQVAPRLDASVDAVGEVGHAELLRRLGAARILLLPSRIEGHGRIAAEARAAGTVPVALDSNVFATGLTEEHGAVTVETLEDMPSAIHALLADPGRLAELAERGRRSAREQLDWATFVRRVDEGLRDLDASGDPGAEARAAMGWRVDELQEAASSEVARLTSELAATRSELAATRSELDAVWADREALRTHHELAVHDLLALRGRKAVRAALRIAALRPRR
jgi:hypothetical protein